MAKNIKNVSASVHQRLLNKAKLSAAPEAFEDVVAAVKVFLEPLLISLAERRAFHSVWTAPGPWK